MIPLKPLISNRFNFLIFSSEIPPKAITFLKKPFYEGITFADIEYEKDQVNKNEFISSFNTNMVLNKSLINQEFVDINKLYKKQYIKK